MPYPENEAEFVSVVRTMRHLGVVQAFGIVLGPPPTRAQQLEEKAETPEEKAELARLKRQARIEAARQDIRDKLAGTGQVYSDAYIDQLVDPAVFDG